jgi:C4-dicarboxylate-binding protein DctP
MQLKASLAAALLAAFCPQNANAVDHILRLTLQQQLSDPIGQNVEKFKSAVEAALGRGISINLFDKGQLYPDYQVPAAVGGGTVEMGVTQLAQYTDLVPVAGAFAQPFLFNFSAIVQAASKPDGKIRKLIDEAILTETGSRVLWWEPSGWNVIFSKQSAINPKTIEGTKIRVFDKFSAEFVELCGGNPQVISESKQSEALDLNLVNATITSMASLKGYELWKRTRYLSDIRYSANILVVVMNEDAWEKLTEREKTAFANAAAEAEQRGWQEFRKTESEIYGFARSNAMNIEEPAQNDLVEWRVCSSPILESFMSHSGKAGQELMAAYGRLRTDPCCSGQSEDVSQKLH